MQEGAQLFIDDVLHAANLALAILAVRLDDAVQVVDVEEENVVEFAHCGIDVAGHGDVDEEQGPAAALVHGLTQRRRIDDEAGRCRGSDDDVDFDQAVTDGVEDDGFGIESTRQFGGPLDGAVGDSEAREPGVDQVLRRELDHLAGAQQQGAAIVEVVENLTRQFDGGGAHRQVAAADVGFGARPLADSQGPLENLVDDEVGRADGLRSLQSLAYLLEDL